MIHQVYLKDTDPSFKGLSYSQAHQKMIAASCWAKENCPSFFGSDIVEISDVGSAACDWMGLYEFSEKSDVTFFELKWR